MIDADRAIRRYYQIADLDRKLSLLAGAIRDAKAHVKDLEKAHEGTLSELRLAARDEGDLPLLDLLDRESA